MFIFFGQIKKKIRKDVFSGCRKFRQKLYLLFVEAESVISGESLVTNIALVWFHTRVQLDVLFQIVISEKIVNFVNGSY